MGGHIQGNGINMAAETVNGAASDTIDGMVNNAAVLSITGHVSHSMANGATPSSANSPEHVIVNGSANAATTNEASQGNHLANSNTGEFGGSGLGNRLPHGTQLFVSLSLSCLM
jgi:hypothetical protein